MASVKLTKFLGEAPKISSELLPDGVAQEAFNVKLYSGDLLPYRTPKLVVDNTERSHVEAQNFTCTCVTQLQTLLYGCLGLLT